jgi:hypothetical protein
MAKIKTLIGYVWGASNLTYLYGDGSNETFYRAYPKFNGVPDAPFWLICVAAVVLAAGVVACLCTAKRQLTMAKNRS